MALSNVPVSKKSDDTVVAFDNFYKGDLEINASVFAAMKGFFTSRGFGEVASDSIATTIIGQAKQDNYNPMEILDSLKGFDNVELSSLVAEIMNYNRFKSSSLGSAQPFRTNAEIARNILA